MSTRTYVSFKGSKYTHHTSEEAYICLLRKFITDKPNVLASDGLRRYVTKGRCRTYLARDRANLFQRSPQLANDPAFFEEVAEGWLAIVNLNNDLKYEVLRRFAFMAGYKYGIDWTWDDGGKRPPPADPIDIEL